MTTFSAIHTAAEHGVLTITLNRPAARNALNEQLSMELGTALRVAQRDGNVRCVVLTGAGSAFCAGQDLKEIDPARAQAGERTPDFDTLLRQRYNPLVVRLRTMEKPVLAAVNGVAAGAGASLALAADLSICARSASLVMAFVHVGLVPDSAATLTLVQQVGYARAAEMCLLGEPLSAEEAHRWGLVNRVVEDDELPAAAREMGAKLAALPAKALGLTKRALNHAWTASLDEQLEYEAFLQMTAGETADHEEGVRAFLDKRKPRFGGR